MPHLSFIPVHWLWIWQFVRSLCPFDIPELGHAFRVVLVPAHESELVNPFVPLRVSHIYIIKQMAEVLHVHLSLGLTEIVLLHVTLIIDYHLIAPLFEAVQEMQLVVLVAHPGSRAQVLDIAVRFHFD